MAAARGAYFDTAVPIPDPGFVPDLVPKAELALTPAPVATAPEDLVRRACVCPVTSRNVSKRCVCVCCAAPASLPPPPDCWPALVSAGSCARGAARKRDKHRVDDEPAGVRGGHGAQHGAAAARQALRRAPAARPARDPAPSLGPPPVRSVSMPEIVHRGRGAQAGRGKRAGREKPNDQRRRAHSRTKGPHKNEGTDSKRAAMTDWNEPSDSHGRRDVCSRWIGKSKRYNFATARECVYLPDPL